MKGKLDISFLVRYQNENITPNVLKFHLANKDLGNSITYRKYQQSLLHKDINNKKSHLRTLQNEFSYLLNDLQFTLDCIDFAHISEFFMVVMIIC